MHQVYKSKPRKLLLLNDQLVCAALSGRVSEVELGSPFSAKGERLNIKWAVPLRDVEVLEGSAVGTLARLTVAGTVSSTSRRSSLTRTLTPSSMQKQAR